MKKLPIILIVLFPFFSNAQWFKSNIDSSRGLFAASFLNEDSFMISTNDKLSLTTNGGHDFYSIEGYAGGNASELIFKSRDTIYGVPFGIKGMLKSYDAGKTWFRQILLMPNGDTAFLNKPIIYFGFFDNANGIIIGDTLNGKAQVFLTTNGGQIWEFYAHPSIDQIYALGLSNENYISRDSYIFENGTAKILFGGESRLLTFSQYGKVWSLDTVSSRIILKIAFKDELNGIGGVYLPGWLGLAKTVDGGNTWIKIPDPRVVGTLSFVKGTAKYPGFYLAGIEKSYASYDDGATWQLFDTLNHGSGTVFFRDAETGICSIQQTNSPVYYYNPVKTGIQDILSKEKNKVAMYPNPAQNWVKFPSIFPFVQLWDLNGKLTAADINTNQLDISSVPNGLYIIKVINENQIPTTQKLVIQH